MSNNAPSGRQLMSIGASEHRAFVRAKARFAGQKAQEHSFVRRNAVFTGHIAMYRWRYFLAESAARALTIPDVPASDLPVLIHSRWNASCPAWPPAASASARCEPFSANRLTPSLRNLGSWLGTMAAGAREQAASCDAFVLSRRPPAPDAPPSRTSPAGLIAKAPSNPRRTTARCLWPGLPQRIPSCSVKDPSARRRSGRGRHNRRGLAGRVGHGHTA